MKSTKKVIASVRSDDQYQQSANFQEGSNSDLPEIEKENSEHSETQIVTENSEQSNSLRQRLDKLPAKYLIKCRSEEAKIRKILTEADELIVRSANFHYSLLMINQKENMHTLMNFLHRK